MRIGFTGTRDGLTCEQHESLAALLKACFPTEFHYGCCQGADEEAADIVRALIDDYGLKSRIIGHPPTSGRLMSRWCEYVCNDLAPAEPYLIRNQRIVDETERLIACPKSDEEMRSGTWATIRYARKCRKPVVIVWPNGSVEQ